MRKVDEPFARRLKIMSFGKDGFTYYSLYTGGYWDIIGFCHFCDGRVAVRLLHFEDEFLDDESFVAEEKGGSYISFNVSGCEQFLHFFETIILQKEVKKHENNQYLVQMSELELKELHYPETWLESERGRWYKYTEKIDTDEKVSLIRLPYWDKKYGIHQISSLIFITVNRVSLENNPLIFIGDGYGLGTITMKREALEEIVSLVRETLKEIE